PEGDPGRGSAGAGPALRPRAHRGGGGRGRAVRGARAPQDAHAADGVRRRVRGRTHRRSTTGRGGERAAPTRPSCGAPDPVGTVSAPLARRGTGSGRERGTTWMWFSPDVDRI